MNRDFPSVAMFSALSWVLLLAAMAALAAVGYDVYKRHIGPRDGQHFHFGSIEKSTQAGRVELTEIIKSHIFGIVPVVKQKVVEQPKIVEAPETKLNLSLTGVITASNPNHRRAMVEIQRGQTTLVLVGTEIGETGAILHDVFPDHILIEHRGKLEKLLIERAELKFSNQVEKNAQTVSALNINLEEFEALAEVNPSDIDISKLLPVNDQQLDGVPQEDIEQDQEQLEEEEAALQQLEQEEAMIQQQIELEIQLQREAAIKLDSQQRVDSSGRLLKKTVPGGLKQI